MNNYVFTKEELEKWVDHVGGIGSKVFVPEDAYYIDGGGNYVDKKSRADIPTGEYFEILEIETYPHPHIKFNTKHVAIFNWYLLFPSMRDTTPQKPIILYPNKCKKCFAPSRKLQEYTFCSNAKCKTRKNIKYIKNNIKKGLTKDNPIIVRCPTCKEIAIDMMCVDYDYSSGKIIKLYNNNWAKCLVHEKYKYTFEMDKWYACCQHQWRLNDDDQEYILTTYRATEDGWRDD